MGSDGQPGFAEQQGRELKNPGRPLMNDEEEGEEGSSRSPRRRRSFSMPLHYPRYTQADYNTMPECQLDRLLGDYGFPATGDVADKRRFAIGTFLWTAPNSP